MLPILHSLNVTPYPSQDLLFEGFAMGLQNGPRGLEPIRLVVPSVHFRDWLQLQIARRFGICMGFEFSMPQDFVVEVFRAAGIERAADWTKRHLEWAILEKICASPRALPLLPENASIRDRFAMARAVADRFDQYAHFRPEMLEKWARGGEFCSTASEDEKWQRELWHSLYESTGKDAGLIPSRLQEDGVSEKLLVAFPNITVIGSGSLDPLLVDVLQRLAVSGSQINVHITLPCLGYLGELRSRTGHRGREISEDGDPEEFSFAEEKSDNRLLVSMGRHAAGAFVLLGKLDEQYTNWEEPASTDSSQMLLGRIQSAVRTNEDYEKSDLSADGSISIHECYGPRRELEVLRDEILRDFHANPDLKPHEVLIAAPSVEEYAPLVSAVFQTLENPLPVRLAELPPSETDPVLEGLLAILEIARGGRGRVSEVLDLLQLRAVRSALGVDEDEKAVEFLAEILRASGLTHGFQEEESKAPGGWYFSLGRLAAGVLLGPDEPKSNGGNFYLPVADRMGSEFQETNRFLDWLSNLHHTLREWQEPVPAKAWAARLNKAAMAMLTTKEENLEDASKCIAFLDGQTCEAPLEASVILDWLVSEAEESKRRAPLTGAILFGRLRQVHNTPCRILALVGMQNDAFPSRPASPSWDLLRSKPKIWDRNARVDDRQMFLDSLLAPTDRLIITASTRNIRSNKNQPLSTCVEELVSAAVRLGALREDLVREHPLQPFSATYFNEKSKLARPIGAQICEIAIAANSISKNTIPFHESACLTETPAPLEISVDQLAAFWKNPARAYLKAQKIDLPMEEEDDASLDFAPINLEGLSKWKLKDAILKQQLRGNASEGHLKAQLAADRGLPPGFLGEGEWQVFQKMEAIAVAIGSQKPTACSLEVEVSGCRIHCPTLLATDTVLIGDCGKMDKPKHWLPHWLIALVAGAGGMKGGVSIFYEGDPLKKVHLPAIDPAEARKILECVLEGYLQGQQRPLPFAPETSSALLIDSKTPDDERENAMKSAFQKARKVWLKAGFGESQVPGEGLSPAAMLAWRDSDPFADEKEWMDWALAISQPLAKWKGSKKK